MKKKKTNPTTTTKTKQIHTQKKRQQRELYSWGAESSQLSMMNSEGDGYCWPEEDHGHEYNSINIHNNIVIVIMYKL